VIQKYSCDRNYINTPVIEITLQFFYYSDIILGLMNKALYYQYLTMDV